MDRNSRMADTAVTLVVLGAVAVYAVTDNVALSNACYLGVLVGASVGAWVGALRAPAGRRVVPRLIAAGISLTAVGDALWSALDHMGYDTDVSVADVPWLLSYGFFCAALWVALGRGRHRETQRVDVDFLIDAVTIVVVSVLAFWSFTVTAILSDGSSALGHRFVWATYPIADAVLLALVIRVLMNRNSRAAIGGAFGAGVCIWLAADTTYLYAGEGGPLQLAMDTGWMIAPVLMARAAWRAGEIQEHAPDSSGVEGWRPQIVVAVAPLLVPPALELVADFRGADDQPGQLFIGTVLLITLAFVRTARLIRSEEHTRRELELARDAALEASHAKSLFLANVSHEIRTPLTTVLASAEILEDTTLDELQLSLLTRVNRSGELLRNLVEGLLDFSRIEAGQCELASTAFDLHAMVADVADVYVPRALESGITFDWRLDQGVPRTVIGDAGRLFQVLSNLLDNGLKFTHEGRVTLELRPARPQGCEAEGDCIEFVVTDTGIGIREEDQGSVFESFTQVDGSATRRYGGTGLGLAICKELTELMGGSLTVRSELGAGTTFTLRVPLARPVPDRAEPKDTTLVVTAAEGVA